MVNVNICKCNNCEELHIDTNPQPLQRFYEIEHNSMPELIDGNCVNCNTDEFLIDVNSGIYDVYSHTIESIEVWKYQTL